MRLVDVCGALDSRYPQNWAESWDRVGLVVGRPQQPVTRVLGVVDVTPATVAEAVAAQADLIVAHHPLLLAGVSSVAATTPAGRMIHDLIEGGIALFVAHTNADVAKPGVNDALADALGLLDTVPLIPLENGRGLGRVGHLGQPTTLTEFARHAAKALTTNHLGVRIAGPPDLQVSRVAVCGGSGADFLANAAGAGVDVYLTGDLKHHEVSDHLLAGGPALIDAGHWATEQPWVAEVTGWLARETGLETLISQTRTDPWTATVGGWPTVA